MSIRPTFDTRFAVDLFSRSSHIFVVKNGTPVAALPDVWRFGVTAETGRPGTVTGLDSMLDLQLLSQCGSTHIFLNRSSPEIH